MAGPIQESFLPYENPLKRKLPAEFFRSLPRAPGVYRMYGPHGILLYVGKAKDLRARLSTYRQVKPENASTKVLRLVRLIERIEIEECESETAALLRENALIRELKPPMNVLNTQWAKYYFIALREAPSGFTLRLTINPELENEGYELHGAFRGRNFTRSAYAALLRLLWLSILCPKGEAFPDRFELPLVLLKREVVHTYDFIHVDAKSWKRPIRSFLAGKSTRLLDRMIEVLLAEPAIPPFYYKILQEDFDLLESFYEKRTRLNRTFRTKYGLTTSHIPQDQVDDLFVLEES